MNRKLSCSIIKGCFLPLLVLPIILYAQSKVDYQQQIDSIAQQIQSISKRLNSDKAELKSERSQLLKEERKINQLNSEITQLERTITDNQLKVEELNAQAQLLKSKSKQDRVALLALIRQRYMQGENHYLKMILDQENPYAVGRLQHYYDYVHQAQQEKLETLQAQAEQLAGLQSNLERQHSELQASMQDQTALRENLNNSKQRRAQSVAQLASKVEKGNQSLSRLKADRARMSTLLKQLAEQAAKLKRIEEQRKQQSESAADRPQYAPVKGGFLKQEGRLKAPVQGQIKYQYGSRLLESGMRAEGVFFNTEQARDVHSIFSGRVLFADFLKGYGLLIIVDHGDQHISLYGHNELLYKKVGDMVDTNEVISKSGTTGGLRKPGLYFEIRKNATPIDPAKWCQL